MNKTYSPSDHGPEAFRVSNEIWGMISIHTHTHQKNPFVSKCDAAWNMYGIYIAWPGWLSRVQLWLWQSKPRQVCQTICVVNGEETEWTSHLPARNINRNIIWPLTPKCLSTDKTACVLGSDKMHVPKYFSHVLLFQNLSVYFSFPQKTPVKRPGSTVQLSGGVKDCVTTLPTQSWSCTVFKMEKQSQPSRVGLWSNAGDRGFSFKWKSGCDCFVWFHYLLLADNYSKTFIFICLCVLVCSFPTSFFRSVGGSVLNVLCSCVDFWESTVNSDL